MSLAVCIPTLLCKCIKLAADVIIIMCEYCSIGHDVMRFMFLKYVDIMITNSYESSMGFYLNNFVQIIKFRCVNPSLPLSVRFAKYISVYFVTTVKKEIKEKKNRNLFLPRNFTDEIFRVKEIAQVNEGRQPSLYFYNRVHVHIRKLLQNIC